MNTRLRNSMLFAVAAGALTLTAFQPAAMADVSGQRGQSQMSQEKIHERAKSRLDRLASRLEIKASQQAVWGEFAKSVEALADSSVQRPGENADAAAVARYRADRAADSAKKLDKIADATAKLEAALNEDQRKILKQVSHRFDGGHFRHARWHGHGFRNHDGAWRDK